ncbi:MAG: hypothetical protein OXI39_02895 [Gemmatimonadota bacterium]|uniref:hypothetical protein n=1 Tax=Candidatus Palauibacter scopulicola TaxID=3056741 RepID=UPI00238E892D|nr:hypothetical protein [Candidatus Palauibacter scopulicola]MDE2661940.1 hypothetical protein [Candidatus Palauibacter scopulicola]
MNKVTFRWNRPLQLLGLLLIAALSVGTEAARAQEAGDDCFDFYGCEVCPNEDGTCITYVCPFGDPRGVGILCIG